MNYNSPDALAERAKCISMLRSFQRRMKAEPALNYAARAVGMQAIECSISIIESRNQIFPGEQNGESGEH